MKKIILKIFIIVIALFPLLGVAASIDYPWSGETKPAGMVSSVYIWALGVVGVIALGVIVYGGILYTVSAGNASKQQDAKAWFTGAIWGLALLLGAYLILYTINPDLVKLGKTQESIEKAMDEAGTFKGGGGGEFKGGGASGEW
ncbi:MAG TPA: hypothetical protein ENH26_03115 [Candidatus Wolfebacteria bacterium]|nr:hypothetical protein [Candidatus Wolfebacteria bacterium]